MDGIDAAWRALHWLLIKDRIVFKLLLITYKIRNELAPDYLNDLVMECTPTHTPRSNYICNCIPIHKAPGSLQALGPI